MPNRQKSRKSIIDEFFGSSVFDNMEEFLKGFPESEFSSGYSISVTQTPEGTKVKAKVDKNTDVNALRKQLQQQYPGARIEIEGGKQEPLIKEISTRELKEKENEN